MKFIVALLSLISGISASAVSHKMTDFEFDNIRVDSPIGQKIMANARRVEQNDQEFDNNWVSAFSIKFQGCHHISQWNEEADGEDDVRIYKKRLVRFRLCPTEYCSTDSSKGCDSGYGDYIVDMNTFLENWFEAKRTYQEFKCEYLENYVCYCEDAGDDNWNEDMCMWDCFSGHGMEEVCMDENPYNDDNQQEEKFEIEEYMECREADFDNGRRKLDQNAVEYFVGPYCASQGGEIFLGVFTDDTCTTFADEYGGQNLFYAYTGKQLPYADANIVDMDCMSCKEPDENNNDGNDNQDADEVSDVCEQVYQMAGKCEANLPDGTAYSLNNNACNYMEGVKIVHQNSQVVTKSSSNKTVSVFIGLFVVSFVLLAAYVYYLKTKLDRASINLSD